MHSANVSGNMFPRFFKAFSKEYHAYVNRQNKYADKFIFNGLKLIEINNIFNRRKNVFHLIEFSAKSENPNVLYHLYLYK